MAGGVRISRCLHAGPPSERYAELVVCGAKDYFVVIRRIEH